jgi:hypothetical protein
VVPKLDVGSSNLLARYLIIWQALTQTLVVDYPLLPLCLIEGDHAGFLAIVGPLLRKSCELDVARSIFLITSSNRHYVTSSAGGIEFPIEIR